MTARVKISQVDILAKVYLVVVHLIRQTLLNLMRGVSAIYRSKWVARFWLVKALSYIVEGGQNDWFNSKKNSQLTDFDHYSYMCLPQIGGVYSTVMTAQQTFIPFYKIEFLGFVYRIHYTQDRRLKNVCDI